MKKDKNQIKNDLENTEELQLSQDTETNGDGNKPHEMLKSSFDNAFQAQQGVNSLKYIVETGENPLDLLMRSILPSKVKRSYALVIAFATILSKADETGNERIKSEVKYILAMLPSMDGESRTQLVSALTGYINSGGLVNDNKNGISSSLKRAFQGQ